VELVDSAEETALMVAGPLRERDLFRRSQPAWPRFFVTDVPARFERVGGSVLGTPLHGVESVDLDGVVVPATRAGFSLR
jgi:glutamate racemase